MKHKFGIIDVGGGNRGAFGAGVFDYLLDNEISFDYCIGISAGSANCSSYVAKQARRNYIFYTEYNLTGQAIGVTNKVKSGDLINLDYLYKTLSNHDGKMPLDFETMVQSKTEFKIVATDAKTGKPVYFDKSDMAQDDYGAIAASCCVPVANHAYQWKDGSYYDGGLSDPIPFEKAFADGCDKVVIILTRPKDFFRSIDSDLNYLIFLKDYPVMQEALLKRADVYNAQLKQALELEKEGKVCIVAPENIAHMKTLSKNAEGIMHLYYEGYEVARKITAFLKQ